MHNELTYVRAHSDTLTHRHFFPFNSLVWGFAPIISDSRYLLVKMDAMSVMSRHLASCIGDI